MSSLDWFVRNPADAVASLSPAVLELRGYRGDTFSTRFTFHYLDGTPVVLTGTWRGQIRETADAAAVLETFAVDVADQAVGIVAVNLTPVQTLTLPTRSVWDLEQTPTAGDVRTWFAGSLYLGGEVTR